MISAEEKEIIRHALCGGRNTKPYRNRYVTGKGSTGYSICEGLTVKGFMRKRRNSLNDFSEEWIYFVTEAGAKAVGLQLP